MITMWQEMIEAERERDYQQRLDEAVRGMTEEQQLDAKLDMFLWLSESAGYKIEKLFYRDIDAYERYARKHLVNTSRPLGGE